MQRSFSHAGPSAWNDRPRRLSKTTRCDAPEGTQEDSNTLSERTATDTPD